MPDYSRRPGAPNENGRAVIERLDRKVDAVHRDRPRPPARPGLVRLDPEESTSWAPGTAWLDMSVILAEGDL